MTQPAEMTEATSLPALAVGVEEASRMTGISRTKTYAAIAAGDLMAFKVGRRRLILVKELEAWINRMAKEGAR